MQESNIKIHLVDGTYELFRNHFGAPPRQAPDGREIGATLGFMRSLLMLLQSDGVTHVAVAFDHVIESFRNDLYPGYKTSAGVNPKLLAQFTLAEEAAAALGLVTWPVVEFEADDAIGTAATRFKENETVGQIIIASPDKDLAQLVSGNRIVCWDRRRKTIINEAGVIAKYGVHPASIPDYLALVGDSADGFPGIPEWGEKSASTVLAQYPKLEDIPKDVAQWQVPGIRPGRAMNLLDRLTTNWEAALLYRRLATIRNDVPLEETVEDLQWQGARRELVEFCARLGDDKFPLRISRWR